MGTNKSEHSKFRSTVGLSGHIYYRDPAAVLQDQFVTSNCQSFKSSLLFAEVRFHPMKQDVSNVACRAAEEFIKRHPDNDVTRRGDMNGEDSFIVAIQAFSDHSKISLKAESLTFIPSIALLSTLLEAKEGNTFLRTDHL